MTAREALSTRVHAAFTSSAWSVEKTGRTSWQLGFAGGTPDSVCARMIGAWLELESADLGPAAPTMGALERNRALGGLAKLVRVPGEWALRLRAELPLEAEADLSGRVHEALAGISSAGTSPLGEERVGAAELAAPDAARVDVTLADLCAAAGWSFVEREPGRLAVDLDLRDVFPRARVERKLPGGAVRVVAEIDTLASPLPEVCDRALALFLLRAGAIVRLVRPFVTTGERRLHVGFEAAYASPPSPRELARTISALSVACGFSGREVAALGRDDRIASAYLAFNGCLGMSWES